jgi:microcystin-dependent protein
VASSIGESIVVEPLMGEIKLLPLTYVPVGWMACQGQILSIEPNQVLFSLLGTNFGGDGQTTFALPDLRTHSPLGTVAGVVGYCIAIEGVYPPRE